jgi:hypothetical protein
MPDMTRVSKATINRHNQVNEWQTFFVMLIARLPKK